VYNFSLSEAAFVACNRTRLRHLAAQGNRRAEAVCRLTERAENFLGPLIVGTDCCIIIGATFTTLLAYRWAPEYVHLISVGMIAVYLLLGEILPKSLAVQNAERTALRMVPFMFLTLRVLGPVSRLFTGIANRTMRLFGGRPGTPQEIVTPQQIQVMLEMGSDAGVIEPEQRELIEEILEFPEKNAGNIMVPRIDMVCVSLDTPLPEVARTILETGYSRLPVYEETRDNIRGIVRAKDVLEALHSRPSTSLVELMREPYFVPETKRIHHLLRELQARKIALAIVIDEYGGTSGLVTIEDILEEIVGEIVDESDRGEPLLQIQPDGRVILKARLEIDDFEEALDVDLPEGDYNTLGGFVFKLAERVPEVGEVVTYTTPDNLQLQFKVLELDGQRIDTLEVTLREVSAQEQEAGELRPGEVRRNVNGTVLADGRANLWEIEEQLGVALHGEEGHTVQEVVALRLGRRPEVGDTVTWHELEMSILEVAEGRAHRVQVTRRGE